MIHLLHTLSRKIGGNKGEGRISKRLFQENKARQIFRKSNISYSLIPTHTCAYHRVRNVCFLENLAWFAFLKHVLKFALLPYYRQNENCLGW